MSQPPLYAPQLSIALVAAATVATGWLVTFALREIGLAQQRKKKSLDLQRALKAEIFDYSVALRDDAPEDTARANTDKILAGGDKARTKHDAFVPRISAPVVFDALVSDISLLPEDPIDSVVQFYSVLSDLRLYAEDLMTPAFREMSAERRSGGLKNYFEMRTECHRLAGNSMRELERSIKRDVARQRWVGRLFGVAPHG